MLIVLPMAQINVPMITSAGHHNQLVSIWFQVVFCSAVQLTLCESVASANPLSTPVLVKYAMATTTSVAIVANHMYAFAFLFIRFTFFFFCQTLSRHNLAQMCVERNCSLHSLGLL